MVQVRIMNSDADRVAEVVDILIPWLRACPDLIVGDPTELGMRGPGSRITFELMTAAGRQGPQRVQAERVDSTERSPARRGQGTGRRALPPGR